MTCCTILTLQNSSFRQFRRDDRSLTCQQIASIDEISGLALHKADREATEKFRVGPHVPAERRLMRFVGSLPRKLSTTASSELKTAARVRGTKVLCPESDSMRKLSLPVCQ